MNRTLFTLLALGALSTVAIAATRAQASNLRPVQTHRETPVAVVVRPDGTRVTQSFAIASCSPELCEAHAASPVISFVVRSGGASSAQAGVSAGGGSPRFALAQGSSQPAVIAQDPGDLPEIEVFDVPQFEGAFDMPSMSEIDSSDFDLSIGDDDQDADAIGQEPAIQQEHIDRMREEIERAQEVARDAQAQARKTYQAALQAHREAQGQQREVLERAREAVRGQAGAARLRTGDGESTMHVYTTNPEDGTGRVHVFRAESMAPSADGGLAARVEALERIARERGFQAGAANRGSGAALEDRVAELERFMQGGGAMRSQSEGGTWTLTTPVAPVPPRAATPARVRPQRISIGGAQGRVMTREPVEARELRIESPALPPVAPAPSVPATPEVGTRIEVQRAPQATAPAGSASSEQRRADIERAMSELRARADELRAEMAKMRAEIEALPRNQR
jgi:hypothetical protein